MRLFALVLLCACIPDPGPMMQPGSDCLQCHSAGGATTWSLAGTVFDTPDAGAFAVSVHVTDANGKSFSVRSNLAGNFWSAEDVKFPLQACVERGSRSSCMQSAVPRGSCNSCHLGPLNPLDPDYPGYIPAP